MTHDLPEMDFQRFWRRLQQLGLNAYEARSYLVLIGHPRFKALELAARAHVPRQKIYEVLDSLVEKGFAQVVQEKTKLFSAVEPSLAVPSYLARRAQGLHQELTEQSRMAGGLVDDLAAAYSEGQGGRGTLDYLRIVSDPGQIAVQYRQMLADSLCGRSPRRTIGKAGARSRRQVQSANRVRKAGRGPQAAAGGLRFSGCGGAASRIAAHETRRV